MTVAFYPMMKMKTKKIIAKNPANVLVQIQGESKADNIGKLGRGCGTHNQQCKRKFVFENIKVTGVKSTLCGINQNYGDTATIKNVQIGGGSTNVCSLYTV
ncbi:hypothetical protein niasHT_012576 [Heterodera trifolii]|uniref:pectate lyase n=1 Tax=Heterodera trifolii TaxID=157864 RepID=A0ABD2L3H1_9BILA